MSTFANVAVPFFSFSMPKLEIFILIKIYKHHVLLISLLVIQYTLRVALLISSCLSSLILDISYYAHFSSNWRQMPVIFFPANGGMRQ